MSQALNGADRNAHGFCDLGIGVPHRQIDQDAQFGLGEAR